MVQRAKVHRFKVVIYTATQCRNGKVSRVWFVDSIVQYRKPKLTNRTISNPLEPLWMTLFRNLGGIYE